MRLHGAPGSSLKDQPKGILEVDEVRFVGTSGGTTVQSAAGPARYIYGDSLGAGSATTKAPAGAAWMVNTFIHADTNKAFTGDSVYAGTSSYKLVYDLSAGNYNELDTLAPTNYSGWGWGWWTANQSVAGATALVFAYKFPNPEHLFHVSITTTDSTHWYNVVDTTPCPCYGADSAKYHRISKDVIVDSLPKTGWTIANIPISAFNGGDYFDLRYVYQLDFAVFWIDTNGQSAVRNHQIDRGVAVANKIFTESGTANLQYFSLQGKMLATVPVHVTAGQSFVNAVMNAQHSAAGAYLVHIKGCGVDARYKLIK